MGVSISGRAESDPGHQYRWYLEDAGPRVAEKFLAAVDTGVERLAEFPD
ncbi:MAG: type II toxin-antitoxin system RelE/ParE family toxin [Planctomycetes bacterium]|nr:type II toxin-antitoxin system RelE/ParE family toxin [Planctomycetota bacterium]